jgi:hypothetical protein
MRARELRAAPLSSPIAALVATWEDVAQGRLPDNARLCPCCGAPMVLIERFARDHAPRVPLPPIGQAA